MSSEETLREQLRQSYNLRKQNAVLVSKYKKYLTKSLSAFTDVNASHYKKHTSSTDRVNSSGSTSSIQLANSANTSSRAISAEQVGNSASVDKPASEQETPLYSKVQVIYGNQRQIRKQERLISEHLEELASAESELEKQLTKTKHRLRKSRLIKYSKDSKLQDLVQTQAERLDRQIRILEWSMHTVEKDKAVPAVSTKRGWFE